MTSVAGDFYDFLVADETHAGLLIADVSGHGVPAALIASMVKVAANAQRAHAADPSSIAGGNERRSLRQYAGPVRYRGIRLSRLAIAGALLLSSGASAYASAA